MISFRTHLVTLVSVFLALAVGVVLGGGPLSEVGRDATHEGSDTEELQATAAESDQRADFGDRFAASAAPALYGGRLTDRQVAVVTMPGADEDVVQAVVDQVAVAGGSVTLTQPLGEALLNPSEKSLVETLGSQLVAQLPEGTVSAEAPTYERMGALLAFALAHKTPEGDARNAAASAVLEGLRGAELLPEVAESDRRAPLVLVVLGDEVTADGGDDVLAGLVRGLASGSLGTVVAGDTEDGRGQLGRLRSVEALGTATSVDGVDTAPGRVATVLALVRSLTTQGGAFGASGADGAVPLG